jgi:tol-pal system-associated acyl-CoA thioesterase
VFPVQIYYEDTDHSGVVYHANYLKYFERAREHLLGTDELVRLLAEDGIGFVVYKCEMTFKEGAVFGDTLEVRSTPRAESTFRVVFQQDVYRRDKLLVQGVVQMVCVDRNRTLVPIPNSVMTDLASRGLAGPTAEKNEPPGREGRQGTEGIDSQEKGKRGRVLPVFRSSCDFVVSFSWRPSSRCSGSR